MNTQVISAQPASQVDEDSTFAKITWRLMPFLFLCYVFSYLDRINVSFAKLQMLSDLGLSDAVYGLGASVFFIGYLVFEVPSNLIMLKVGARRWIARIMITWGLVSMCFMFVKNPTGFYVLRFFLGVAEAGFFPAILYYLTLWYPAARRGKITAIFLTGIPVSGLFGGPLSGWIMHHYQGFAGLAGWQWLFVFEGFPTIILGVIALFYLGDKVSEASWLSDEEKAIVAHSLAPEKKVQSLHSIKDGLTNPKVLLLGLIYLFYTMGLYGLTFWLPSIIKASGVTDALDIGLLSAIPYGAAALTMILVGRNSDLTGERRWHLALAGVIGALALGVSVFYADNTFLAMIALTVGTMGVMTTISQFWSIPPAILGGSAAAVGFAFTNSVGSFSGIVAPYVLGLIKTATGTTGAGVIAMGVSMIIGGFLVFRIPAEQVNVKRS